MPHDSDAREFLASAITQPERELSALFAEYTAPESGGLRVLLRRPIRAARALSSIARLPRLDVRLSDSVDAAAIRARMTRESGLGRLPLLREVTDILPLPQDPAQYNRGGGRQTLRQRTQAARRAGVTWHAVSSTEERHELLRLAAHQERNHPMAQYRIHEPDNSDLADHSEWLVAESADGEPLLLAAIAVDGEWALMRYFRTLGHDSIHSDTRFLMAQALVDHLVPRGVRYVFNAVTPFTVEPGLRHFQRMLGWRICRVRIDLDGGAGSRLQRPRRAGIAATPGPSVSSSRRPR